MHCSLPFRQLSELSYLLQCFNLFICHLASLPISNFGKLLRKTSANYFGKLRKTTSVKYIDENSSGRNLGTKTPQTEASGKCSSIFCPSPSPSNKAGWAYHSKLLGDKRKQNNRTCMLPSAFCKFMRIGKITTLLLPVILLLYIILYNILLYIIIYNIIYYIIYYYY